VEDARLKLNLSSVDIFWWEVSVGLNGRDFSRCEFESGADFLSSMLTDPSLRSQQPSTSATAPLGAFFFTSKPPEVDFVTGTGGLYTRQLILHGSNFISEAALMHRAALSLLGHEVSNDDRDVRGCAWVRFQPMQPHESIEAVEPVIIKAALLGTSMVQCDCPPASHIVSGSEVRVEVSLNKQQFTCSERKVRN
jgi:hypothetical protein